MERARPCLQSQVPQFLYCAASEILFLGCINMLQQQRVLAQVYRVDTQKYVQTFAHSPLSAARLVIKRH